MIKLSNNSLRVTLAAIVWAVSGLGVVQAEQIIEFPPLYVNAEYIEIERLRDTKAIIVIDKKEIEQKGYTTVSDVLRDVPSITVGATGMGQIDIRGQGSDQAVRNIQVLIDGAPITTLINHPLSTNYDIVPLEQIERIEIIPGGGSVMYGSGAAGGIINITTNLRSLHKPLKTVVTEWNSDGYRLNLNYGEQINSQLTAEVAYAKLDRDLYFKNTFRNSEYVSAGLRYEFDANRSLTFRASHLEEDSQYIGNVRTAVLKNVGKNYLPDYKTYTVGLDADGHKITQTRRYYLYNDRKMDSYNISYQQNLNSVWKVAGDIFYNNGYYMGSDADDKKMEHDTKGIRLKLDHAYGQNNNLLIGVDLYEQTAYLGYNDYKSVSYADQTYRIVPLAFDYQKETRALYLLNSMTRGKYRFTQGLRREQTDWNYDKVGNNIDGAGTSTRWNTAAELSMAYQYNPSGRIYARWERGYTTPDGMQITDEIRVDGNKKYVGTNAADEQFDLYEIGLRDKLGISTIDVTLFTTNTDNQMNRFYFWGSNSSTQTLNLLKTRRKGIEVTLAQTLGKLNLKQGYAYLHGYSDYNSFGRKFLAEQNETIIDWTRSGLKKVPKHKFVITADYSFNDRFNTGLSFTYFGRYNNFLKDADKADGGIMQSHALVDWDWHYKLETDLTVYGGITNLLNKRHYEYTGDNLSTLIPGPERTYYLGLKYNF